jgi:fumarate hydratase class I
MRLQIPLSEKQVRALRVGDEVEISGTIYTGRDAVHHYLAGGGALPKGVDLRGGILFHCGPVVIGGRGRWKVVAAGPTTSIREEPYQAAIIRKFRLRGIIGKGGMGPATLDACKRYGCVYLHAVGGAAQLLAAHIREVLGVFFADQFGSPEAVWKLRVEKLPAVVTMDVRGNSLHQKIARESRRRLAKSV